MNIVISEREYSYKGIEADNRMAVIVNTSTRFLGPKIHLRVILIKGKRVIFYPE